MLIFAALILGVVSLSLDRTVDIDGSTYQFTEFTSSTAVDALAWLLALAVGVPLLLSRHPVEQRFVLAGVTLATFFYEFLQASGTIRYGIDGYDEGSWIIVKVLELGCLVGACWIVRKRSGQPRPPAVRLRLALIAVAILSGALVVGATQKQWSQAPSLIESTIVPHRTPLAVWILLVALPSVAAIIVLAVRGTYGASISLATLATLGVLNYLGEAAWLHDLHLDLDESKWRWTALAHLILAALAWFATFTSARSVASAD